MKFPQEAQRTHKQIQIKRHINAEGDRCHFKYANKKLAEEEEEVGRGKQQRVAGSINRHYSSSVNDLQLINTAYLCKRDW